jgi:hypothetical protein
MMTLSRILFPSSLVFFRVRLYSCYFTLSFCFVYSTVQYRIVNHRSTFLHIYIYILASEVRNDVFCLCLYLCLCLTFGGEGASFFFFSIIVLLMYTVYTCVCIFFSICVSFPFPFFLLFVFTPLLRTLMGIVRYVGR